MCTSVSLFYVCVYICIPYIILYVYVAYNTLYIYMVALREDTIDPSAPFHLMRGRALTGGGASSIMAAHLLVGAAGTTRSSTSASAASAFPPVVITAAATVMPCPIDTDKLADVTSPLPDISIASAQAHTMILYGFTYIMWCNRYCPGHVLVLKLPPSWHCCPCSIKQFSLHDRSCMHGRTVPEHGSPVSYIKPGVSNKHIFLTSLCIITIFFFVYILYIT